MPRPSPLQQHRRTRTRVDHAWTLLLKAAMAEGWRPEQAAQDVLHAVRSDRRVLRLLQGRVARTMLDQRSLIIERAAVTLHAALAAEGPDRTHVVASQGGTRV